jgi:hypothetical protein
MQQAWNPKRSMVSVCDIVIDYGWPWICIEAVSERLTQKSLAGGTAADFDQVVAKLVEKKVKQLDVTIQHQPKTARGRRTLALDPGTVDAASAPQAPDRRAAARRPALCGQRPRLHHAGRHAYPSEPIQPVVSAARPRCWTAGHPAAPHAPLLRHRRAGCSYSGRGSCLG